MKCVMYWYFFSKSVELMDTVLMVIRKKNGQITFLHVFHHASMLNIWWWVMMFIPAGASECRLLSRPSRKKHWKYVEACVLFVGSRDQEARSPRPPEFDAIAQAQKSLLFTRQVFKLEGRSLSRLTKSWNHL